MKNLIHSPKTKAILWILGGIIVLLAVFSVGAAVGYRRALFASQWGRNYYANFAGRRSGFMGLWGGMGGPGPAMHGTVGEVISVSSSSIAVKDPQGAEQSVAITPRTEVRSGDAVVAPADIKTGSWVVVIGGPGPAGQVEARFIRMFGSSSSLPVFPPPPPAH